MKYAGMPTAMWAMFVNSFQRQLTAVLGYDTDTAREITRKAKPKYREILAKLPEFEKGDRFRMNIVGCAMLCAEGSEALLLPSVAAMLSFCGFCVHAQVHDSISSGGLTYSKFFISRIACGGLSFLFCRAACLLFPDISEVFLSTSVPTYADVSLSAVACASMLFMSILLVLDLDIPKDLC